MTVCVVSCEVASANLAGHDVPFYLSSTNFDKPSAAAPCVGWMIKGIPDDSKTPSLLVASVKSEMVKFHVACICCMLTACYCMLVASFTCNCFTRFNVWM